MLLKKKLKTLIILHTALCVSLMLFGIFAYYQNGDFTARMDQQNSFIYIVPLAAITGYFLSQLLFKKRMKSVLKEEKLSSKLKTYQVALLLKYALLEAPAILALLAYYWSGNALHLVIAIALIVYLFVQRPTMDKIKKELPLSYEEQKQ